MIKELMVSSELFNLTDEFLYILESKPLHYYELIPGKNVTSFFKNLDSVYYYAMNNLETKDNIIAILRKGNYCELVCTNEIKHNYMRCFDRNEEDWLILIKKKLKSLPLNLSDPQEYRVFLNLFYKSQKKYLKKIGYEVKNGSIYTKNEDYSYRIQKSKNNLINSIQKYLHVYPGFSLFFKKTKKDYYIHIKPKSSIIFEKDLYSLYNENILSFPEIHKLVNYVSLPIGRSGRFISFMSDKAADPLKQPPFNNMSFIDYAKFVYNLNLEKLNANMMILNVRSKYPVWYFTSELSYPSFSFRNLSQFDPDYVGRIISKMKAYSSQRPIVLNEIRDKIKISFCNKEYQFGPLLTHVGDCPEIDHENINKITSYDSFFKFKKPIVNMKNTFRKVIEVGEYSGHNSYPGDLLKDRNLLPLDVPNKVSVKVICINEFEKPAEILLSNLQNGIGNYPSFENLFGSKLKINSFELVNSFLDADIFNSLTSDDDCILLIGPRRLNDPVKTIEMYVSAEKNCLARGIPAQYIADDPKRNPIYDGSLIKKSQKTEVLFGIALNILGKIGARILEPSPRCINKLLPNSTVLSYNVTRVFEKISDDLMNSKSPGDIVRKSIPISAPIVLMNKSGTEIIHQDVHELSVETGLFSGSRGLRISNEIPKMYKNVIVHKDGPFHKNELDDLKQLNSDNRLFIPVSIVTGNIPRLFQSIERPEMRAPIGLVFPLSDNEFLMATTLYTPSMRPEKVGWPNPIQINIHDEILPQKFTNNEKSRILYQIWLLTRTYIGTQIPTRRPLTIHYSNKMSEFIRKVGEREPEYFKKFKNKRNKHNYMPRMFL